MTTLLELADEVEKASGPDRELDATIGAILDGYTAIEERKGGWIVAAGKGVMERSLGIIDPGKHSRNFTPQHHDTPRYTASLDAAMQLVPEGLNFGCGDKDATTKAWAWVGLFDGPDNISNAATPALALTAASLRAIAKMKDSDQ